MYGSSSPYPGYLSPNAPPNPSHQPLYSPPPPPPQDFYAHPPNPYNHLTTSYQHPYAQTPYVRAESPQIIPLAHQVNLDPNPVAFLTFYRRILDELTSNSKYIITNATIIAGELLNRANDIARCLDDHITQCHPEHRLYAMYALDSICKNIGPPYVTLLSGTISRIFLDSYRLVDQRTKVLMEQLLATWRDGGPNGSPLFGTDAQWTIERQLFGAPQPVVLKPEPTAQQNLTPQHYSHQPAPAVHSSEDQQRAVIEIDRLLEIGSIEQRRNPENRKNRTRMDALSQLKTIVRSTVISPIELHQINQQLEALSNEFRALQIQQQEQDQRQRFASPIPGNGTPNHVSSALAALSNLTRTSSSSSGETPPSRATPLPEGANSGTSGAANDLIKSLMLAGLLPANSNPQSTSTPDPQPEVEIEEDDAAYTSALSSITTSLTATSLSKTNPPRDLVLTSTNFLPLRCKQCANRYADTKSGKKNLQTHLDWHFRQNRRSKESKARGMHRGWNAKIEDWIRGGHDDSPLQAGSSTEESSLEAVSSAQQSHLKAQFDSSFVVTPSDPEIASKPCPICKEPFKSEWSEDEEEWIWKGVIKEGGAYYHASCHHSAKTLKENVAAKDSSSHSVRANSPSLNSVGGNSRNNTPKPDSPGLSTSSLPATTLSTESSNPISRIQNEEGVQSSLTGNNRKRKAEDEEDVGQVSQDIVKETDSAAHPDSNGNEEGSDGLEQACKKDDDLAPPTKKLAI